MQRWPIRALPDNLNPVGTRCIQITIPDDDDWERAMYAEVSTLAQWMRWQRDLGHNGKPVADIWLKALRTWKHCDGSPSPVAGLLEDFEMPLRVDCDCNVFVTCCDGTEKQLLTADQVRNLLAGQPGAGSPQPPAGGGCQQYSGQLLANGRYLVPTVVSTGDTVELGSAVGATNDGSEAIWHCPDGSQFFAGLCAASGGLDGSDPLPTVEHMRLIVNIDGAYYDAMAGPITVPGGVSNAQVYVQVNDSDLTDNTGQIQFVVTACNNQSVRWTHTLDFTLSPHGMAAGVAGAANIGTWTPGVGLTNSDGSSGSAWYRGLIMAVNTITPFHILSLSITYDLTKGTYSLGPSNGLGVDALAGAGGVNEISILHGSLSNGTNITQTGATPQTGTTGFQIAFITDDDASSPSGFSGSCVVKSLTITGDGPEPAWP
jgi:hypothetical protein